MHIIIIIICGKTFTFRWAGKVSVFIIIDGNYIFEEFISCSVCQTL